jgi:hypothetical protein
MYVCQYCNKVFKTNKSKNRHERETCPKRPGAIQPLTIPAKAEKLEIKKPPDKTKAPSGQAYHCIDCGTKVTKGQEICPGCGERLNWSALEVDSG